MNELSVIYKLQIKGARSIHPLLHVNQRSEDLVVNTRKCLDISKQITYLLNGGWLEEA